MSYHGAGNNQHGQSSSAGQGLLAEMSLSEMCLVLEAILSGSSAQRGQSSPLPGSQPWRRRQPRAGGEGGLGLCSQPADALPSSRLLEAPNCQPAAAA